MNRDDTLLNELADRANKGGMVMVVATTKERAIWLWWRFQMLVKNLPNVSYCERRLEVKMGDTLFMFKTPEKGDEIRGYHGSFYADPEVPENWRLYLGFGGNGKNEIKIPGEI